MTKFINRSTMIPTKKSHIFSTYQNNRPAVNTQVSRGRDPSRRTSTCRAGSSWEESLQHLMASCRKSDDKAHQ